MRTAGHFNKIKYNSACTRRFYWHRRRFFSGCRWPKRTSPDPADPCAAAHRPTATELTIYSLWHLNSEPGQLLACLPVAQHMVLALSLGTFGGTQPFVMQFGSGGAGGDGPGPGGDGPGAGPGGGAGPGVVVQMAQSGSIRMSSSSSSSLREWLFAGLRSMRYCWLGSQLILPCSWRGVGENQRRWHAIETR